MTGDKAPRGASLGGLRSFALSAAIVLALSLAVALPLWYLAINRRAAFTEATGALAAIAALFFAARAIARSARRRR
jgi:hypothetical protein